MSQFTLDIGRIRNEARTKIEKGAVTRDYPAERKVILGLLEGALATEWICVLRYTQHSLAARGMTATPIAEHFEEHAREEQEHATWLAKRIRQLGGTPSLDPATFAQKSHTEYKECDDVEEMIRENLFAERVAIETYREIARYIGDTDPSTRRLIEKILEVEEEHADELADLLNP